MNNQKRRATIFLTLTLTGCASMYGTPEERQRENSVSSDYSLCSGLARAALAPAEIRNEWAMELRRRGVDCSVYANAIRNEAKFDAEQNSQLINTGLKNMSGQ